MKKYEMEGEFAGTFYKAEDVENLERENAELKAARIKQADYIDNLLYFVFMKADTKSTFNEWFKIFDKEMGKFYERKNN